MLLLLVSTWWAQTPPTGTKYTRAVQILIQPITTTTSSQSLLHINPPLLRYCASLDSSVI